MRYFILLTASLLVVACNSKKTCEQPTETWASIENRTPVDQSLEFVVEENGKEVPKVLELKANSKSDYLFGHGSFTNESYYTKGSFNPHDPTCTSTPVRYGASLPGVTEASFAAVNVCWPRYTGPNVVVVEKHESCPPDSHQQAKPQVPKPQP